MKQSELWTAGILIGFVAILIATLAFCSVETTPLPATKTPTATSTITPLPTATPTSTPTVAEIVSAPTFTPTSTREPSPTATEPAPTATSTPSPTATAVTLETGCLILQNTIYTIQRDDTLWHIADCAYGRPEVWPIIFVFNPQLTNPDLIHAGNPLIIPREGRGWPSQP